MPGMIRSRPEPMLISSCKNSPMRVVSVSGKVLLGKISGGANG